jgi:primosomal protein N' (replication factor Y)
MTEPGAAASEQLALLRSTARAARSRPPRTAPEPAPDRPVARVAVDTPLAHLDRTFDYLVTADQADTAVQGARVRVRFAGRLLDGYVVERTDRTDHHGRLAPLQKVVSPEPVLAPETLALAREVVDHYGGTVADVLRLAIPPRHARTEAAGAADPAPDPPRPEPGSWSRYTAGPALVSAVATGAGPPRAVWTALPGPTWTYEIAILVAAALSARRGALVVLPDHRDVEALDAALRETVGPDSHVVLTAEAGPAERYRRWLAVRRDQVRAVVGTRAAMFAPVQRLGLALVWDDGDDLHAEPRAPYPHVRTVLAARARLEGAAYVLGGWSRSTEAAALVAAGWAHAVAAPRDVVRATAPAVRSAADDRGGPAHGRLPTPAWRAAADGLRSGPVLVQVPRAGYLPGLACDACRRPARCAACGGPLAAAAGSTPPTCRWCAVPATAWACPHCGERRLRATRVGSQRTAEELGRAFPSVPVRVSGGGDDRLAHVGPEPALVVATPGAEPVADSGYAAALLLDGWTLLARPDLRAGEEALRRWLGAAGLVRPAGDGGRVVVDADPGHPAVQAMVRWDPATYADRELSERSALRLPPSVRLVSLQGAPADVAALLAASHLPPGADVLGPVDMGAEERVLLRADLATGRDLVRALRAAAGVRSAAKDGGPVRLHVDPGEVG